MSPSAAIQGVQGPTAMAAAALDPSAKAAGAPQGVLTPTCPPRAPHYRPRRDRPGPALTRSLFTEPVTSSSFRCRLNLGGMVRAAGRAAPRPGGDAWRGCRERPGHPRRGPGERERAPGEAPRARGAPSPAGPEERGQGGRTKRPRVMQRPRGGGCKSGRCPAPALPPGPTVPAQPSGVPGAEPIPRQRRPTQRPLPAPLTGLRSGPGRREMAGAAASQLSHRPPRRSAHRAERRAIDSGAGRRAEQGAGLRAETGAWLLGRGVG